jgi:phosphate transport system substrate-binding protein
VALKFPAPYRASSVRGPSRAGRRALTVIALTSTAALALAACSSSSSSTTSTPTSTPTSTSSPVSSPSTAALPTAPASATASLSETGSTLLYPLFNLWAPAYKTAFPNITITTAGTGSGTGISSAAAGTADIGASDAYLSSADTTKYPNLENIPLAISAQQVNYNLPGLSASTHLKLNGTILAEMYQGKITTWNDSAIAALNPGVTLPATKVVPLHRSDSSGDTFLFTTYLSEQDSGWASGVSYATTVAWPTVSSALAFKGNSGMVTGCKSNPGCVAYIGISYLSKTTAAGLGQAALLNGSGGYELPTSATISAEAASFASTTPASGTLSLIDGPASGAYPIINYEYAIVSTSQSSSTTATDIKALLQWILTTGSGSTYLSQVNFQPLPASVVSISEALAAKIS